MTVAPNRSEPYIGREPGWELAELAEHHRDMALRALDRVDAVAMSDMAAVTNAIVSALLSVEARLAELAHVARCP